MVQKTLFLKKTVLIKYAVSTFLLMIAISGGGCEKKEATQKGASQEKASEEEILIGVAGPMTGDQSKIGGDLEGGARLAVEEWNAKGGVLGRKIRLEIGDDQHDPKQAVSVANKLINLGIVGMVGHFNSSASIPASTVYHDAGTLMITPGSTNPRLTEQGFWNVFRVVGRDDQQGSVAADFIVNKLTAKRVAILHDKTTYGQGLAKELQNSLEAYKNKGVEITSFNGVIQGNKDFRGILTTLKQENPDIYFFGGIFPEGGLLAKQAKEVGLTAPMMSGDGVIDPKFIEIAGAAAEGTYLTFTPDPDKIPHAADFLKKYRTKYGEDLAPYAIYAYDATNILLRAVSESKSTDGRKLAETIRTMKYDGAIGHVEFDGKGDVKKSPYIVWTTQNGRFEEYWKPEE
ncbi:MAG: branched-chain amino acid ABC transporter substrate-binding protein [Nitrospiria bacterium]